MSKDRQQIEQEIQDIVRRASHPYRVGAQDFSSFTEAVRAARAANARVLEIREDGTEIQRWSPPPPAKKRVRHVIRNADGTLTEFGKIKR